MIRIENNPVSAKIPIVGFRFPCKVHFAFAGRNLSTSGFKHDLGGAYYSQFFYAGYSIWGETLKWMRFPRMHSGRSPFERYPCRAPSWREFTLQPSFPRRTDWKFWKCVCAGTWRNFPSTSFPNWRVWRSSTSHTLTWPQSRPFEVPASRSWISWIITSRELKGMVGRLPTWGDFDSVSNACWIPIESIQSNHLCCITPFIIFRTQSQMRMNQWFLKRNDFQVVDLNEESFTGLPNCNSSLD